MRTVEVNGRWPVVLPDHRADRPEWPWHEQARFDAMHTVLARSPGATLWDVGAELGDHAAVFASWGCELVLIEPNPQAWPCIAATIEANDARAQVAAWCWAFAGESASPAALVAARFSIGVGEWPAPALGDCTPRAGMAHLSGRPDPDPYPTQPTTTIDALVAAGCPPPDALTIDVEGAELLVLRGAHDTLDRLSPLVWLSIHPELLTGYGHDRDDVHDLLAQAGYCGTLLGIDHEEHWEFTR